MNILTNKAYAVKLELSMDGTLSLEHEYEVLRDIRGADGIFHAYWFSKEANYNTLVLGLLGPSLHQLFSQCKQFHVHSVAYLADQLISIVIYDLSSSSRLLINMLDLMYPTHS